MSNLSPDQIQWRVGATFDSNGKKMGQLLGYINARTAMEELDKLDKGWTFDFAPISKDESGVEVLSAKGCVTVGGVTRCDVGVSNLADQDPTKTAISDSLKRAAVHHGVGRELYELPRIVVECEVRRNGKTGAPKALPVFRDGKWTIAREYGYVRYSEVADAPTPAATTAPPAAPTQAAAPVNPDEATTAQKNMLRAKAREAGLSDEERKALLLSATGKHSFKGLLKSDVDKMVQAIESAAQAKSLTGGEVVA